MLFPSSREWETVPSLSAVGLSFLLFGLTWAPSIHAQSQAMTGDEGGAIQISVVPTYQRFTLAGQTVTESALRLTVSAPIIERLRAYVQGQAASAGGDNLTSVSGLDDTRLGVRYARSLGPASLRLRLDAALPTGVQGLSPEELSTASLLGQDHFDFQVPGFGQGTSLTPNVSIAVPVTEGVVVGLSGTYRYLGTYEPLANMTNAYDPGDGWTVTGGLDVRLTPTSVVSGDVSFSQYGTDTVGGTKRFKPGRRLSGMLQYVNRFGFSQVQVVAQYQDRESSRVFFAQALSARETRVFPRRALGGVSYRTRLTDRLDGTIRVRGLLFRETGQYDQRVAGELMVRPEYSLRESVTLSGRVAYTFGGVSGLEGGLGVHLSL